MDASTGRSPRTPGAMAYRSRIQTLVAIAPTAHTAFHSAWKRTSHSGFARERVGGSDIEHPLDRPTSRDREHERRSERGQVLRKRVPRAVRRVLLTSAHSNTSG